VLLVCVQLCRVRYKYREKDIFLQFTMRFLLLSTILCLGVNALAPEPAQVNRLVRSEEVVDKQVNHLERREEEEESDEEESGDDDEEEEEEGDGPYDESGFGTDEDNE
jgi:hypothetical protein